MLRTTTIVCLLLSTIIHAQPQLKPSIGLSSVPLDTELICPITTYLGDYDTSGLAVSDTAADFQLFDLTGMPYHLHDTLAAGKAVLLVNGSLTCPAFRSSVNTINQVASYYGSMLSVAIVYTVEAHPVVDISPYFGFVNTGTANQSSGILYEQPDTYLDRKTIVSDMLSTGNVNVPVIIDGPCNEWWSHYGPAPNNAYIIDTNGFVFAKHDWFNQYPHKIYCDLDSLFGQSSGLCSNSYGTGNITFNMLTNDTIYGPTGSTLSADMEIINTGSSDVLMSINKLAKNYALGWETSLCTNVCYSTTTDSITMVVPANDTIDFHFYFYTDLTTFGMSSVRLGFRNIIDSTNLLSQWLYGITNGTLGNNEPEIFDAHLYPNPVQETLNIDLESGQYHIKVFDVFGRTVIKQDWMASEKSINIIGLAPGYYYVTIFAEAQDRTYTIIKQ